MKMKEKERSIAPVSNQDATIHSVTRRRFLETSVIAGAGTLLGTAPFARAWQAPLVNASFYKGMCYQPMPFYRDPVRGVQPYSPSIANTTKIFFGSDIAYNCMEPLWGTSFTSRSGTTYPRGRNDVEKLQNMGVNLVRLYDWEPRNYHKRFLDRCLSNGIKVLVPVSNYFLKPGEGYPNRLTLIPNLIRSFSNGEQNNGTDYHPAIAGIIMGNEPRLNGFTVDQCVQFTKDWVSIEQNQFSGFSMPLIAHPVDFATYGGRYPAWGFFTPLLQGLSSDNTRNLQSRLFLAPNTFNIASYLFHDAESSGKGYVQLTYDQFHKPLLFTEIGQDRTKRDYLDVVEGQLRESIDYGAAHPEQLLGICHFQFADKVWKCPTNECRDSEGAFGTHSHTQEFLETVNYVEEDFTHFDCKPGTGCPPPCPPCVPCDNVPMLPDRLRQNLTYNLVVTNYGGRP
jgi:hypothetical protein